MIEGVVRQRSNGDQWCSKTSM